MASLYIKLLRRAGYITAVLVQHELDKYLFHFIPEIVQARQHQQLIIQVVAFFFS